MGKFLTASTSGRVDTSVADRRKLTIVLKRKSAVMKMQFLLIGFISIALPIVARLNWRALTFCAAISARFSLVTSSLASSAIGQTAYFEGPRVEIL
jgi:hypothetical protein